MGKVVLFAVLTMDGCLADSSREAQEWLSKTDVPDRFGIVGMKETARPLSEYTSLTTLVLDKTSTTYWDETKTYKDGSLKAVYRKNEGATVQKVNTSRLKRLFRL